MREQQQRWFDELGNQISELIDSNTDLGQPGAGPAALAGAEASATEGKPWQWLSQVSLEAAVVDS